MLVITAYELSKPKLFQRQNGHQHISNHRTWRCIIQSHQDGNVTSARTCTCLHRCTCAGAHMRVCMHTRAHARTFAQTLHARRNYSVLTRHVCEACPHAHACTCGRASSYTRSYMRMYTSMFARLYGNYSPCHWP